MSRSEENVKHSVPLYKLVATPKKGVHIYNEIYSQFLCPAVMLNVLEIPYSSNGVFQDSTTPVE